MVSQEFHILTHYFNFIFHNSGIAVLTLAVTLADSVQGCNEPKAAREPPR